MTSRITAMLCATAAAATAAAAFIMPAPAGADDTVKLAYIDPLSGGGASIGEVGLKTFNYLAEVTNAKGGILGKKLEIVPYDNKLNAQESLVQVQKAIDSGIRFITQGNGSSVAAAIEDFVAKYNERNPGKEVLYFNYAAVDPVLTNDKCSYWHFRWDANSDIKMDRAHQLHEDAHQHQKALSDQPGLFVRPGGARRGAQDDRRQAAGHRDRRRRGASACSRSPTSRPTSPRSRPPAPTASSPATGARISRCCSRPPPTPACRSTGTPTTPAAPAARPPSSRRTSTGPGVRDRRRRRQ